jgi:queuine tRNA-ribosyltransferase
MSFRFDLQATDGVARAGLMHTAHGSAQTPVFMAVGTQATVKGLTPAQLEQVGTRIVLGNTYHLCLRPGDELVAHLGGLHRFMAWPGPILTDSGGYQVFSLAAQRKLDDRGVVFRSHIDGALLELTPERAIEIQQMLGSDIAMCLDECPPGDAGPHEHEEAVRRTILWAGRCRAAHRRENQALFGIVQGGTDIRLRGECARALVALDLPGYALGGFSVGETMEQMITTLRAAADHLPPHKPRYLMGVGRPQDILLAIDRGIDMFDCVLPTRNGRNAQAFTLAGPVRLRNACHKRDPRPLESDCTCPTCRQFSRAYLHHLFQADEMLGPTLLSLHNLAFYNNLVAGARQAILAGDYARYRDLHLARWEGKL